MLVTDDRQVAANSADKSGVSRRTFLKIGATAGGTAAAISAVGYGFHSIESAAESSKEDGKWVTVACWNNCSCTGSRCLLQALVVDGVPRQVRSDFQGEDTPDMPQVRACSRGFAQVQNILAPSRLKYPMVRKHWEPGGGDKSLRGKDEWRRVSWDEALDLAATEIKRIYDEFGPKSVYYAAWGYENMPLLWDPMGRVFNRLGGSVSHFGTVSWGSWPRPEMHMIGTLAESNDALSMRHAKLLVFFGADWAVNKGGITAHYIQLAKEAGARIVVIDPWLNKTTTGLADQWIPIRPGTDSYFLLGAAHYMIQEGLHDQDFLDKYTVGFDKDHLPPGADPEGSFKDYVLGTYDNVPKTPEWASAYCGVPAEVIRDFAVEIATTKPMSFYGGMSASKIPAGESFCQIFYSVYWMTGNSGKPGECATWRGPNPNFGGNVLPGSYGDEVPPNPLYGKMLSVGAPDVQDEDTDWLMFDYTECWDSMLEGKIGRDTWRGGKKDVDIRMIYHGHANFLNSQPGTNSAIKAHHQVEFVMAANIAYTSSVQYADIVFPISTPWERPFGQAFTDMHDHILYWQQAMEPLYETRSDMDLVLGIAERLGMDVDEVMSNSWKQKEFNTLAGSLVKKPDGSDYEPLITITQEDIDEWGVEGTPQQGRITIKEFAEKGIYKVPRKIDDALTHIHLKEFVEDPVNNPLQTASGKLEIYCQSLADDINSVGYSTIYPIGKVQEDEHQGWTATTEEYPLILFTPHSLRRAHTNQDNVPWLRQAFPQPCFISSVDAEERGIKTDDTVLMESPHGKVLRRAKVMEHLIPGAVALEDGAWLNMNDDGIDVGGNPNVLQNMKASGQGVQTWTGTILQVTKWDGKSLEPDHLVEPKLPVMEGADE